MSESETFIRGPRQVSAAAAMIAVLGLAFGPGAPDRAAAADGPRLVLLVVIDQFRYDYLERFDRYFGDGGFRRFAREGATFSEARYEHATTDTCPGHAVIATGYWGNLNGITANSWYDTAQGRKVDCAATGDTGRALNLLRPTIGDSLKEAVPDGKVIVASGKRSAAVVLGGQDADLVLFSDPTGRFEPLRQDRPPPTWVQAFNDVRRTEARSDPVWTKLLPEGAYAELGPDDVAAEAPPAGMERTFPHLLTAGLSGLAGRFYAAMEKSPFADELLVELAMAAVREERLGRGSAIDLLAISLSANDRVGHTFGPDSHEAMDTIVRTDRQLERLLDFLDQEIGLERTLVVLTADHGAGSLPEVAKRSGHPGAGRVSEHDLTGIVTRTLTEAYGVPLSGAWVAFHDFPNLFLDEDTLRAEGVPVMDAEILARTAVLSLPGIQAADTRSRLEKLRGSDAVPPRVRMALLSFRAGQSGHVVYQVLPYNVVADSGTNHGSHWDYDRHVPLMWLGGGVRPGSHAQAVSPADVTPTIKAFLGLDPDPESPGRVLQEVLPEVPPEAPAVAGRP